MDIQNTENKRYSPPSSEDIKRCREWIKACPNPYTKEEVLDFDLDDPDIDYVRYRGLIAREKLAEYGIPFEDTTE